MFCTIFRLRYPSQSIVTQMTDDLIQQALGLFMDAYHDYVSAIRLNRMKAIYFSCRWAELKLIKELLTSPSFWPLSLWSLVIGTSSRLLTAPSQQSFIILESPDAQNAFFFNQGSTQIQLDNGTQLSFDQHTILEPALYGQSNQRTQAALFVRPYCILHVPVLYEKQGTVPDQDGKAGSSVVGLLQSL